MNQFDGAERLDIGMDDELVVVNPNPGRPYVIVLGGKEVTFHPMQKYRMAKNLVGDLCTTTQAQWREMQLNAQSERQEWAKRKDSPSQYARDKASKFCDENGDPHTKPPKRPMLVRLDMANGQKWYEEGLEEAAIAAEQKTQKPAAPAHVVPEPVSDDVDIIEIEEPKKSWNMKQLLEYCRKNGAHIEDSELDRADVLVKRARMAFEAKKLDFTEKKINFRIK